MTNAEQDRSAEQFFVARQNPPPPESNLPLDPRGVYGTMGSFREEYPGPGFSWVRSLY